MPDLRVRFDVHVEFDEGLSADESHALLFISELESVVHARFATDPALGSYDIFDVDLQEPMSFTSGEPFDYEIFVDFPGKGYRAVSDSMFMHELNLGFYRCAHFDTPAARHFDPQRCPPVAASAWQPQFEGFRGFTNFQEATQVQQGTISTPQTDPFTSIERLTAVSPPRDSTALVPRVRVKTIWHWRWTARGFEFR